MVNDGLSWIRTLNSQDDLGVPVGNLQPAEEAVRLDSKKLANPYGRKRSWLLKHAVACSMVVTLPSGSEGAIRSVWGIHIPDIVPIQWRAF